MAQIDADEYGDQSQLALEYKYRSLAILGEYGGLSGAPRAITLYADFLQGKKVDFDSLISEQQDDSLVQILGSIYLAKQDRVEEAITLLSRHENSLEAVLLLVQLYLHQGKLGQAEKQVLNASSYSQDSVVFNLAEAYVNAARNGESLRGSLYFFEELSHSHPTFKTLLGDLVLNMQLHQFPEADEVLRKIGELQGSNADLLANEYAYAQIQGDSELAKTRLIELTKIDANHQVVVDYKEKDSLFDSIVDKYSVK